MLAAIPNPIDLLDPTKWFESMVRACLGLLAKGSANLMAAMLGWFGRVTEADLTRPWALDVYGRVIAVVAGIGVLLLIIAATAGAVRRGPAGALEPLARLGAAGLWIGLVRVLVDVLQRFGDALTIWLAPNLHQDIEKIMAAMTAWPSTVPPAALAVWLILTILMFIAVLVMAIQLFIRKYAILILWAIAPFVGIFSIADRGFTLLKKHSLVLVAVILAKPLMAFCISLIAAPLASSGGEATLDEGVASLAGLGVAAFAPWLLLAAMFSSIAAVASTSKAGDPVAGAGKAVSYSTRPADIVQSIKHRLDGNAGTQQGNQAAWGRNRPTFARDAATAGGAAVATGGAALPAVAGSAAKNGATAAGNGAAGVVTKTAQVPTMAAEQVRTNGGQVSREFGERHGLLVADKAGRVVDDVGRQAPGEPQGLNAGERYAWRREHLTHDEPTPLATAAPRWTPEGLSASERRAWQAEHITGTNVPPPLPDPEESDQ